MSCSRGCCPDQLSHYRSVSISSAAMPSRKSPRFTEIDNREKKWDKDMPAYKAMRQDGLQPKSIDGAAAVQAGAETKAEVEAGVVFTPEQRKQYQAVTDVSE